MPISVACANGHLFNANEKFAGKRLQCPKCGETIQVPQPVVVAATEPPVVEEVVEVELDDEPVAISSLDVIGDTSTLTQPNAVAPTPLPSLIAAPRPTATMPASATSASQPKLVIGLLVGGGLAVGMGLAAVCLSVVWFVAFRNPPSSQTVAAAQTATLNGESNANSDGAKPTTSNGEPTVNPSSTTTRGQDDSRQGLPSRSTSRSAKSGSASFKIAEAEDKLRRVALGLHNRHDQLQDFVPLRTGDTLSVKQHARMKPTGLSWRVHILPYVDQKPLFEKFHLDEPWDSPHNLELVKYMPDVYRLGGDDSFTTRMQVLTGPGMMFGQGKPVKIRDATDGTRHTIMVIVLGPEHAVEWTKPDSFVLDPKNPVTSLGTIEGKYIVTVAVNAELLMLPKDVGTEDFMAMATPSGKEIIDADRYRSAYREEKLNSGIFSIFSK